MSWTLFLQLVALLTWMTMLSGALIGVYFRKKAVEADKR